MRKSEVQRPNHYTTEPHKSVQNCVNERSLSVNESVFHKVGPETKDVNFFPNLFEKSEFYSNFV